MEEYRIAFVGAGNIAQAHAFALAALPYYYLDVPKLIPVAVTSTTAESRDNFAKHYGFANAVAPIEFWQRDDINTLFILGPNNLHYTHLQMALAMRSVHRIYLEKPICVTKEEEDRITQLGKDLPQDKIIQVGFQFLQMSAIRRALQIWKESDWGNLIHFYAHYLHSGYLNPHYRMERISRLKPAPEGGAIADLGSHAFSLLLSFLGERLEIVETRQSGFFPDVPVESDLCTTVLLCDNKSKAVGTVIASRISSGAYDLLELELRTTRGALRVSTEKPDVLELYNFDRVGEWKILHCGSDYETVTHFPSRYAPSGWLRSLIHAHYLFFGGRDKYAVIPNLKHAVAVQRLVRETSERLAATRKIY